MTGQELFASLAQSDELTQLRAQVAQLTRERDEARARVEELARELRGLSPGHDGPMNAEDYVPLIRDRIESLVEDVGSLNAIVERLSAPPVVPEGWCVSLPPNDGQRVWLLSRVRLLDAPPSTVAAGYRALAWALEHDARPPHAGDEVTP